MSLIRHDNHLLTLTLTLALASAIATTAVPFGLTDPSFAPGEEIHTAWGPAAEPEGGGGFCTPSSEAR